MPGREEVHATIDEFTAAYESFSSKLEGYLPRLDHEQRTHAEELADEAMRMRDAFAGLAKLVSEWLGGAADPCAQRQNTAEDPELVGRLVHDAIVGADGFRAELQLVVNRIADKDLPGAQAVATRAEQMIAQLLDVLRALGVLPENKP